MMLLGQDSGFSDRDCNTFFDERKSKFHRGCIALEQTTKPRYVYPLHLLLLPALRVLLGIRSSVSHDAALLLKGARPRPRVLHAENIPPATPFVCIINHYDRCGLAVWWGVAPVIVAVAARRARPPRDLRLLMAREWWYPRGLGRAVKQPLTRWLFGKISHAYGTIRLPPVVDEYRGTGGPAVRRALALTRGDNPQLIGLSPEGRTGPDLALCEPPAGAGLFLLMLTHDTIPCLPAGIFEDDTQVLTVNFGAPFYFDVPRALPRAERDRHAARQAMLAIGRLLPERMWGVYRDSLAQQRPPAG